MFDIWINISCVSIRLDRLLAIVIKLLSCRRLTTRQLAEEFDVSVRTIYRDLQTISLSGVPIVAFQGQGGGWELDPEYLLDRRILSVDDLANIVSALQTIHNGVSHEGLAKTLDKMRSLITPQKRSEIESRLNHIVIDYQPWYSGSHNPLNMNLIHKAIETSRLLSFDYYNLKKESSQRRVEPMTLILKGNSWYLFAYCLQKQDYRLFRLSRMSKITRLETSFQRREATFNADRKCGAASKKTVELSLRFHRDIALTISDWFGLEMTSFKGDYGHITVTLPDNDWLNGFLLGFGDKLVVESPKTIASRIKQLADAVSLNYQ